MTGLWAFEVQLPYQKYQGPAIVVRCTVDNSNVEISQNVVAFSEYTNFKWESSRQKMEKWGK